MKMIVSTALTEVPVNVMPLVDDGDFKTVEDSVAYNAGGMDLVWNFVTTVGAFTQTAVTPTTGGAYDWTNQGNGMYSIEIPASGGGSINNNANGYGWFTGVATGVLPWRGPVIEFVDAVSPWDALVADYDTAGTFGALVMKTTDTITIDNTALDDMWSRWMNTATSDTGAGETGRAIHYLAAAFASSGVFSEAALANAPAGGGGGGSTVDADVVDDSRTWFATDNKARNIITLGDNFAGTLAMAPDLNPGTTILSVDSVSITGAATVTATGLTVNRAKTRAHFTVPALTTTGTYTVIVTVTTIDGQVIPTTATLRVQ